MRSQSQSSSRSVSVTSRRLSCRRRPRAGRTRGPQRSNSNLADLASVTDEVAAQPGVAQLAGALDSALPARARVPEAALAPLLAALWLRRRGEERAGLAVLVRRRRDARARWPTRPPGTLPPDEVGFVPSRGVAYGSGLEPAPHLVGERARGLGLLEARRARGDLGGRARRARAAAASAGPRPCTSSAAASSCATRRSRRSWRPGYTRVERVGDRGELAVRGDILDVFPTTGAEPVRIELFGDEVERISRFSVFTQRSLAELERCDLQPAREARRAPGRRGGVDARGGRPGPGRPRRPGARADRRTACSAPGSPTASWRRRAIASTEAAASHSRSGPRARLRERVGGRRAARGRQRARPAARATRAFEAQRPALAGRGISEAEAELLGLVRSGLRVVVAFPHRGDAERTQLALRRVEATLLRPGAAAARRGRASSSPSRRCGAAWCGRRRAWPSSRPSSCSGAAPPGAAVAGRLGRALSSAADLRPGDHVVHVEHGVGRFLGFDTKTVGGVTRDYVNLQFKGEDRLFVPHDQLAKLSRYIGADGRAARALEARRQGLAHAALARARGRARARRRAAAPLRRAPDAHAAALRRRGGLARAHGARVRLHRDRGSGPRDRRGARGSHRRAADGPPDLRRRRLRQDRGRDARRVPGRHLGPPGARAGAHDAARAAAPADVPRPLPRLPGARRGRLAHARGRATSSRRCGSSARARSRC